MKIQEPSFARLVAVALCGALFVSGLSACTTNDSINEPNSSNGEVSAEEQTAVHTIIDDAGRSVTIPRPENLQKIYFTSSLAQIFCLTLAPELAGGSATEFTQEELAFLPRETGSLPFLGTLSGGKELNPEAIMAENIQLIFSFSFDTPTEADISESDDLQSMTGIPVVLLNASLENTAKTYRTLGMLLGKEAEAEALASYCETALSSVEQALATIPEEDRISLYYAEGPDGLQTEPEASSHALAFSFAGAKNVAADVELASGKGMSPVSLEQVLAWNPEVIIAWDDSARGGSDELIRTSPNWSTIDAVQNGRVYTMPNAPFSWCDRPPAANRILGIQWVANLLYPEAYDINMVETTQEFYALFYHRTITEEQAETLLGLT